MDLRKKIREVPDFPKPGINFKDITTLLLDPEALREAVKKMSEPFAQAGVQKIVGIESRGFIFGMPMAYDLGLGFVPVRKPKKLPAETLAESYVLEYGENTVEIHRDAVAPGEKVLLVDDLLATGGTMAASVKLIERLGGVVAGISFLIELKFLKGRSRFPGLTVHSVVQYED